ncbi:ribosome recycling factor [Candidatus Carsonella ruddii]|uniref:ribosome recycling factor n=1 Tax=Carsonella ruddii TaxID=114186 RepID=UPI003D9A496B
MDFIFITNEIKVFEKILLNYEYLFKNFSIKNLGIKTLNNLKINFNKKNLSLENICFIKNINEKVFLLEFKDINLFKQIIKNRYFENYGFQIKKIKNNLELTIPNLSLEFRNNILKILKSEFFNHKDMIELNRKKILLIIKKKYKSLEEIKNLEKNLEKNIIHYKKKLKEYFDNFSNKILNE